MPKNEPSDLTRASPPSKSQAEEPRTTAPVRHRVRRVTEPPPAGDDATRAQDYEVGYGRPPRHTRFKAGQSGNPKGRPKGARGLNAIARELLTARVPVRTATGEKKMHRIEAVLHKTFELALKGNLRALSQILSLYAAAVPEIAAAEAAVPAEDLTPTDIAILEEYKAQALREAGR